MKRYAILFLFLCLGSTLFLSAANAQIITSHQLTISPTYGGAVSSNPSGINSCSSYNPYFCSASFVDNSLVRLTATAISGYGFDSWGGDCSGNIRFLNLFMNSAKSCTATFTPCTYMFTPEEQIVPETGGDFTVAVSTVPLNCSWTAFTEDSWMTITSGESGTGAGLIHYTVDPNSDRVRQGMITVSGTEGSQQIIIQEGPGSGYIAYNNHTYKRYDMFLNWQDAKTFCEGRGGYLATITNSGEQAFVFNNFVSGGTYDFHQCWIGGFQPPGSTNEPGGDWQWVTGEPWSYANWCNSTPCYPPFAPYDPTGNQDSLLMLGDIYLGRWMDTNGVLLRQSFVCEWTNLLYELSVSKTGTGSGTVYSSEFPNHLINCCPGECEPVCSAFYSPNTQVTLNAIPDADSDFGGWTGACTGMSSCSVSMNIDKNVNALFSIRQYTVSTQKNQGGSISPQSVRVLHGDSTQFDIFVNQGFSIAAVTGCGGSLDGFTYYTGPITSNCTVTVNFAPSLHTVSTAVMPQAGGSINPTSASVAHNETAQFTVLAAPGYHLLLVSGCEGAALASGVHATTKKNKKNQRANALNGSTYTTGPITGECTVTATFEINPYTVTADAGPGGSINPSGKITVTHGATPEFTAQPDPGYHVKGVNGTCGGSLNGNTYTTNPVTGDCTVHAEFALNEYTVLTSAGQGGGIDPGSAKVTYGNTAQFTITPDTGFQILSASGCGGALNGFIYTTGEISANCTVTAVFEIATYTVSILKSGSGSGSIIAQGLLCEGNSCSGEYAHGTKIIFNIQPDPGFRVADIKIDGISIGAVNTFTFKKMTGNHSIEIIFAPL